MIRVGKGMVEEFSLGQNRIGIEIDISRLSPSLSRRSKGRFCSQRHISFVTVLPSTNLLPSRLLSTDLLLRHLSAVITMDPLAHLLLSRFSPRISQPFSLWFEGERVCVPPPYDLHVVGLCFRSTLAEVCMYLDFDWFACFAIDFGISYHIFSSL